MQTYLNILARHEIIASSNVFKVFTQTPAEKF